MIPAQKRAAFTLALVLLSGTSALAEETTENRDLPSFVAFEVRANFMNVDVAAGESQSVRITTDGTRQIATEVQDRILYIRDISRRRSRGAAQMAITVPELHGILVRGNIVHLEVRNIERHHFRMHMSGSGDARLSGACGVAELSIAGSPEIFAKELACRDVTVDIGGSGDAHVSASDEVSVSIVGSGHVDVYGDGRISKQHVDGSGRVTVHGNEVQASE